MARQLPRIDLRARATRLDAEPPVAVDDAEGSDLALVVAWLTRLHLLYGVPFNYLVPDERMLPVESLRFFQLDPNWMDVLLDGAYSVGFAGTAEPTTEAARPRVLAAARARAPRVRREILARTRRLAATPAAALAARRGDRTEGEDAGDGEVSGFLLRSAVVAGWPGIEVRGYADSAGTRPLALLRLETVAPSLLLCLFSGTVALVELREPAEALHFGVEAASEGWQKELRYASADGTNGVGSFTGTTVPVPLRSASTGVVSVAALAASMQDLVWGSPRPAGAAFTAAEFGLEMVEGVQVVRFQAGG
ncbi:MAG TPA: hypothetical protein VHG28_20135 [Longimicrobiaceae bacterium]|nr:hypothetical protein [Longimicrobiaceae bacterium]